MYLYWRLFGVELSTWAQIWPEPSKHRSIEVANHSQLLFPHLIGGQQTAEMCVTCKDCTRLQDNHSIRPLLEFSYHNTNTMEIFQISMASFILACTKIRGCIARSCLALSCACDTWLPIYFNYVLYYRGPWHKCTGPPWISLLANFMGTSYIFTLRTWGQSLNWCSYALTV